jgi:hypothetical protein
LFPSSPFKGYFLVHISLEKVIAKLFKVQFGRESGELKREALDLLHVGNRIIL